MTSASHFRQAFPLLLSFASLAAMTGCQSSGSKWARWNPFSKGPAVEAVAAEEAPAYPSTGATPMIETGDQAAGRAVVASTGNPATATVADATTAVAATTPSNTVPVAPQATTTAPAYPTAVTPVENKPATTAVASTAGPYDPNAYKPAAAQASPAQQPTSRYASVGNRYSNTKPDPAENLFDGMPDFSQKPAAQTTGQRYASATPAAKSTPVASAPAATAPLVTSYPTTTVATTPQTTPQATPQAESIAAPPAGATPSASTAPVVAAAPVTPIAKPNAAPMPVPSTGIAQNTAPASPATIGTLPASSVYSPAAPAAPAAAPATEAGSPIRLTSLPGEYRPGGTGTYRPKVNIASRPESPATQVVPAAGATAYPATNAPTASPTQLR